MIHKTLIAVFCLLVTGAQAELAPETGKVNTLAVPAPAHWVWVADIVFNHMEAGKSYLIDGDEGRFLAMISTGFGNIAPVLPRHGRELYSPETYYSRGTRGERTDLIVVYDAATLEPVAEVEIPPKRAASNPTLWHAALTDDDRFVLVYNFTPAQSVSVVDVAARTFVGEIEAPGCALVYPSGPRRFHMICGDGSLLTVHLDDEGRERIKTRSQPFFDPNGDFVTEKPVRHGDRFLFASVNGDVVPVDVSGETPRFEPRWSMLDDADRAASWRIGGLQHFAVHQPTGRLYALMHQGGVDTHKDPGTEVWVFDLAARKRVQRIALENIATALQVTQDDEPLLFTAFAGSPTLDVYDAGSGDLLRTVAEIGLTPTVLQTPAGP